MRKLLCKLGLFEGVYINHYGTKNFRIVRYDKSGERYVKWYGHVSRLNDDGTCSGHWNYMVWQSVPFDTGEETGIKVKLNPFSNPRKSTIETQQEDFSRQTPAMYSWKED